MAQFAIKKEELFISLANSALVYAATTFIIIATHLVLALETLQAILESGKTVGSCTLVLSDW